jgi:hypothetical protein
MTVQRLISNLACCNIRLTTMKFGVKLSGLLLIAALLLPPFVASGLVEIDHSAALPAQGETVVERHGRCHAQAADSLPDKTHSDSRKSNSPSPTPANYKCCLIGHDVAVVQPSTISQPAGRRVEITTSLASSMPASAYANSAVLKLVFSDLPYTIPLRV